jgi:hypothetical protein
MAAVWVPTLRQSALSIMLVTLVLCSLGALVTVLLGLLFRRFPFWGLTTALVAFTLVLSVAIALLDKLGFG